MPLTQEKRLDGNFSNNNDQSYLHKKFKKMASTMSVLQTNMQKCEENRQKETNTLACNSSIPNGSIAAAHPEIEKIKEKCNNKQGTDVENNVQINFIEENNRLSDVNSVVQVSGKTSITEEFLNKTENLENDFIRDCYSRGRYMCPYCKLPCAKPSVLQKHIRAHTNERPYPCIPCGFAFKTRSNLYKHQRSRTHALRLQGMDVPASLNEEDLSGGSESDTSIPPTPLSDTGSEASVIRLDYSRTNEISSPELTNDSHATPVSHSPLNDFNKSKTIYKPKFRASFYQGIDEKDKIKKTISTNADFLTEHISKIISDNEAIVDVIETPLQKKYGKIKQIAESKQFLHETEMKHDASPLNLTKNSSNSDNSFRKRSHSESFSQIDEHKHPLNPEGSIIKDLLLKSKANGLTTISGELIDGLGLLYVCPLCQIVFRSIDNLETHRLYYCKGSIATNSASINASQKDIKVGRPESIYVRSNSINVRLPETQSNSPKLCLPVKSPAAKCKPDNIVILKQESNDIIAPLPSPGPLLGNTRLVDARTPTEYTRKADNMKIKTKDSSPKRRIESRSDTYSPRSLENISPRSAETYPQSKIRCVETKIGHLRSIEELSPHIRHNSTSLQMFGGEVKIVDHSGSTTTLRIEPSKNQLSPILIQQNLSPSKFTGDSEGSSVVVRSGLHSGGTIMHNPPTPKEVIGNQQPQTSRITISTAGLQNLPNIHDISHFPFPPLSAITAYNPLTLPPLSPSTSPNGATKILHGGKLIPHVPGMPGPNTAATFVGNSTVSQKVTNNDIIGSTQVMENIQDCLPTGKGSVSNYDKVLRTRSPSSRSVVFDADKYNQAIETYKHEVPHYMSNIPIIKVKNVEDTNTVIISKSCSSSVARVVTPRHDQGFRRISDSSSKTTVLKENINNAFIKAKHKDLISHSPNINVEIKSENEIRNFNFENLITKAEIYNNQIQSSGEVQKNTNVQETITSDYNERSETSYFQKNTATRSASDERKPKFLRPSTLPLKPGTFTPKRHHGITPNANTMPLVSPETPRPAKAYGQLYLNGNAYTYLGLKCSTKVFYCTINRPQPTYVPNQHFLSMYSNWQLLSELTPDPLGLSASSAMSLYDSRHRPQNMTAAVIKQDLILTHSSQWNKNSKDSQQAITSIDAKKTEELKQQTSDAVGTPRKELTGGFESNEEYTYVRGRGRGRYVCSECGIRCKKPSMLKKHIRTHTDVRPYTCTHCAFSFKTKGNLTKHMKSKAHYKKCCELGINPNEGNEEGTEMTHCSGETDDETDSEGDEGNEGETESSDTELYKSRLPEHEAAHCLLSLGGCRNATSATPGLITSARPSTYPYTPVGMDNIMLEPNPDKTQITKSNSVELRIDVDNEPMDLSRNDVKTATNVPEIPTAKESSVLASLASNTAKLPQHQSQWSNGEPMLHTYLTERALLDSKIKQSQLSSNLIKLRKVDMEKNTLSEPNEISDSKNGLSFNTIMQSQITTKLNVVNGHDTIVKSLSIPKEDNINANIDTMHSVSYSVGSKRARTPNNNSENAKHVVSEYLKHARLNLIKTREDSYQTQIDNSSDESNSSKTVTDEKSKCEEPNMSESDSLSMPSLDHEPVARKVVIGVGGVAFKVTKGKEFEGASYSPGRLMEDGRRVCDFCNKTFTKPSQLRLHLNIHYMERPFRCSVCAVSFRTRGHLQKHERSGSHHNKVSMTSTFGAATSFNPRPFRCSDCNIAFRIHGHLAKHLRSKMHVMRLECLFKLPFGTFTEIERAGVSLTDIDTTDCASSLASLQSLARKLHEKDPSKLEYRESNGAVVIPSHGRESSEDEDAAAISLDNICDNEKDSDLKTMDHSDSQDIETRMNYSATDN
ncbi:uncharacterized protein shn [Battus philenor]|uniref:uncharacterized protein shn n=1 Tax=Battus philenor TaxID=42288 RepID=UPI0035D0219F